MQQMQDAVSSPTDPGSTHCLKPALLRWELMGRNEDYSWPSLLFAHRRCLPLRFHLRFGTLLFIFLVLTGSSCQSTEAVNILKSGWGGVKSRFGVQGRYRLQTGAVKIEPIMLLGITNPKLHDLPAKHSVVVSVRAQHYRWRCQDTPSTPASSPNSVSPAGARAPLQHHNCTAYKNSSTAICLFHTPVNLASSLLTCGVQHGRIVHEIT
jgi:hypothetical protein